MGERKGQSPEREQGSVGGGARRTIAWDELEASAVSSPGRATVGTSWRKRRTQEHLAVGAFALLARELALDGCDPVVLSLVTRASSDEVRHAEICRRFAVALLGADQVPERVRGLPRVPMHPRASATDRVLFHVVEMCCMSETLTGVYLTEMLARTADPVARTAVESLLEDEIDHGRVGWAYLAERARGRRLDGLAETLPAMLERSFQPVVNAAARAQLDDPELEKLGYLGAQAAREIYMRALRDVILPGFERVGVDLGAANRFVSERGWCPGAASSRQ